MTYIPNSENLQSKVERYKQRLSALRTVENRFYNGLEQQRAGGIWDEDTKLIRFGVRDYDPEVGRWTSKELLGFSGARNWYVYAGNNPVMYVDVNGLFSNPFNDLGDWLGQNIYDGVTEMGKFADEVVRVITCADWGKLTIAEVKILSAITAAFYGIDAKDRVFAWDTYWDGVADIFEAFDRDSEVADFFRNAEIGNTLKNFGNSLNSGSGNSAFSAYITAGLISSGSDLLSGFDAFANGRSTLGNAVGKSLDSGFNSISNINSLPDADTGSKNGTRTGNFNHY